MCIICDGIDISDYTRLYCNDCRNLTHFPELPFGLNKLNCYNCSNLTHFPDLSRSLTELDCYNCPKLTHLPDLPRSLNYLYCYKCPNLTHLPEIHESLQLDYSYCRWLKKKNIEKVVRIQSWFRKNKIKRRLVYNKNLKKYFNTDIISMILKK